MATGQQLSICTTAGDQRYPRISGDTIVWYDERNGGRAIYGYDLSTSQEFMLPATCDPVRGSVRIDGDIVVWNDLRNGNRDIYAYDLADEREFAACLNSAEQYLPDVSGDVIVWADSRNGRTDIIGYEISTGEEFVVCDAPKSQWRPVIGDRFIAWEDNRRGYSDLMAYELATGREYVVDDENNRNPFTCNMDGDTIVWQDQFPIPFPVMMTKLPEPATLSMLTLGGLAVLKRRRC
jgi:beta propeller repeat protein